MNLLIDEVLSIDAAASLDLAAPLLPSAIRAITAAITTIQEIIIPAIAPPLNPEDFFE